MWSHQRCLCLISTHCFPSPEDSNISKPGIPRAALSTSFGSASLDQGPTLRHVNTGNKIPGGSKAPVWNPCWKKHLLNSFYPRPTFGAVRRRGRNCYTVHRVLDMDFWIREPESEPNSTMNLAVTPQFFEPQLEFWQGMVYSHWCSKASAATWQQHYILLHLESKVLVLETSVWTCWEFWYKSLDPFGGSLFFSQACGYTNSKLA